MTESEKHDTEITKPEEVPPAASTDKASPQALKGGDDPPPSSSPDLEVTEDDSLLAGGGASPDETQPSPSQKARDAVAQCPACTALEGRRPCSVECYARVGFPVSKYEETFGALSPEDARVVEEARAKAAPKHPQTQPSGHPWVPGQEPWSRG